MTSSVSQFSQTKGFPNPNWVLEKGTGSPQTGHGGDNSFMLVSLRLPRRSATGSYAIAVLSDLRPALLFFISVTLEAAQGSGSLIWQVAHLQL